MNAFLKKLIAIILFISSILSMASCSYVDELMAKIKSQDDVDTESDHSAKNHTARYPNGYTGGFPGVTHDLYGYYWLETYEEVLEAAEILKSNGSTLRRSVGFDCDGELLDVKWCFTYSWSKAEPLEDGENFFDRKIDNGEFVWYAFYKDVTIDELIFSDLYDYDFMSVRYPESTRKYRNFENVANLDGLSLDWGGKSDYFPNHPEVGATYEVVYNGKILVEIYYGSYESDILVLPSDYHDEFLKTLVITQ